ncbi:solute carrier organic anion transporter family member 1B3-like [Lytechinus variegatus]|uniref:solute carrier organic anion transporter family member 1B3-like n=1 Tax=Lytechinus variegatus TaxID=7654 RepID=UPI001BB26A3D|nr:solute carrier organic anion transporter family member 1B3-like [Lytechinus variegatus]
MRGIEVGNDLFNGLFTGVPDDKCSAKEKEEAGAQHLKALWLYLGQAIFGLASSGYLSLGISYMDDGVPRRKAPLYLAAILVVTSLGAFIAFGLSAFSLSFHTDFYKINVDELGYDDRDPRWIGAWWLGYLVYAGLFVILAVPFFFFPKEWPHLSHDNEIELQTEPRSEDPVHGSVEECTVVKNGVDALGSQINGFTKKGKGYKKFENESTDAPKQTPDEKGNCDDENEPSLFSFSSITGYLYALRRLLTNFTFMAIVMGSTSAAANFSGYYTFIGRYLQTEYDITPADVSIILSGVTTPTSAVGIILSGVLINRMDMKERGLLNFAALGKTIAIIFIAGNFAIFCSKNLVAGVTAPYPGSDVITLEPAPTCLDNCECEKGVYTPVCGSDGLTYVTPCHAGCTGIRENDEGETVYTNCTCVSPTSTASTLFEEPLTAVKNQCPRSCRAKIITFICLYCVFSTAQSSMGNSVVNAKLRVVDNRDKALAMALGSFFNKVLAFIPAPIYYGLAIQSTCAMFQESCGETGNCLIYDTDHFAMHFWSLFCGLGTTIILCYLVAAYSLRRNEKGEYIPLQLCKTQPEQSQKEEIK